MSSAKTRATSPRHPPRSGWMRLWEPCDIASVVFFRIGFALIILVHVAIILRSGWIDYYFSGSGYHLKYFGFEWVQPLDGAGMRQVQLLTGLAAMGVGLGFFYRLSAIVLFVTFTYTFLSEAAIYQNHYYFTCLIAFLLTLIPAHRSLSVDAWLFPHKASSFIPNWCRWVLMFVIALPYTYGGIAKLSGDWLQAMPLRIWIPQKTGLPLIGPFLAEPVVAWGLSYAGLLLDLAVVPLLLWRKTRLMAYLATVAFHLMNAILFKIDIFPWMMILLTTIFFAPDWPRRLLRRPLPKLPGKLVDASDPPSAGQRALVGLVAAFVLWQLIFPFRQFLYPGPASWTEEGQNFSWRMMLHNKDLFVRFYARDGATGQIIEIPIGRLLTQRQIMEIAKSPEQIAAASHHLADVVTRVGLKDVEIYAVAIISLNGRKPQLLFDPNLNLLSVDRSWKPQSWVLPLKEELRTEPWDVPSRKWPETLGIMLPSAAVPRPTPTQQQRQRPRPDHPTPDASAASQR